ncbi:VPS10 domain-containing protein [Bradyrhizobium genosp. A]|uniref:VPS10 domain-containing protein n=1 Tax=Bradyrhizobium genosp. A TaxID=83626 RepID=UPI003CF45BC2
MQFGLIHRGDIVVRIPFTNFTKRRADFLLDSDAADSYSVTRGLSAAFEVDPALLAFERQVEVSPSRVDGEKASTERAAASAVAPTGVVEPAVSIVEGGSVEINGAGTQSVTFLGSTGTLKIDHSLAFTGTITGLMGEDAIDFADISFGAQTKVTFLGDHDGGKLTITDGINAASISLQGDYLSSTWTMSSDVNGGTIVVDPVASGTWETLKVGAGGWVRNLDIASDGTVVGRTDTYGAYLWNGSQWEQLVTANSLPTAFVSANQNNQTLGQGVYEIQIANSNTQIFYMMYDGYVFKSTDRGTTWTQTSFAQVSANPNDAYAQYGQKMAIDPSNPNIVYVGTPSNGLWVTKDGGVTWQQVSQVPSASAESGLTGILFDPAVGGVVGGVTQTIFAESNGNGVYLSTNGGASWKLLTGGPTTVVNAAVSPTGAYFATDGQNLWRYSGGAWTQSSTGMGGAGIQAVAVNPNNANEIVAVSPAGYLSVSYDGGTSWSGVDWSSNGVSSTDIPWLQAGNTATSGNFLCVGGVVFNPLVPNQIIASAGTGVWNATVPTTGLNWNTSVTWNDQSLGIEQLVANQIIVPTGGHPVLASWDRPFFYVSDINSYPSTYGPVASVNIDAGWSVDYASSNTNFVTGLLNYGKAVYSTDGGQTWNSFASLPTFPAQANGGTIAASTPQNIVLAPANGVQPYYTLDGGATWKAVTLPGVTDWSTFEGSSYLDERSITADRVLANTFYLYYAGHGVYRSTDGGASWTQAYSGNDGFGSQWNGYISPFTTFNNELMSVPGEASNLFFTGGNQSGYMPNYPFMRSTDGGTTWKPVANVLDVTCFGFGASATPGGYPAVYIVGYVNNVYGIWQSVDNAQSWTQMGTYPNSSLDNIKTIAGDPTIFGQVYVGFMGSGYAVLTASTSTSAHISSIAETPSTGNLNAGNAVTLTLNLSSSVTVAGGTPTLTLNDGGVATYTGGSGTGALTFSYTVAAGQNTALLSATAVNLNGAKVSDSSGNAANLSLTAITQAGPQIDTTAPTVSSVAASGTGITSGSGDLNAGKVVTLTVNLSEAVTVAGGTPTLTLNDGGVATYSGGSGSSALTFSYTVAAGQNTPDLTVTAVNLNSATVKDAAGNAANLAGAVKNPSGTLQIDTTAPTVSTISETPSSGSLNAGKLVTYTITMSEAVTLNTTGGSPTLALNDGGTATYVSGSGTNALTFNYTVVAGQNTPDLMVSTFNLNGATVVDGASNGANLSLAGIAQGSPAIDTTAPTVSSVAASGTGITSGSGTIGIGSVVTLTLNLSEAVTVAGGRPTLTLNDGGVATYSGGSGSSALTFSYTVAAGQNTPDLAVTAVNLNSATVKDAAGNAANLAGAVTNPSGTLQIDTTAPTAPTVSSVAASGTGITSGSGDLNAGKVVTLTVNLSEAVTVAGGTPTLTLNDGGVATYSGGSGSSALTFSYTVAAGQNTPDLTVTAVNLNSATVKDAAGNAANLAGAVKNPSGTLQIDTTAPTVSSVAASGTGITSGSGDLNAGKVVTLTVNLSEAVTVAGGTPTLTLNDGGVATYSGGSGSSALTFSYTVAAGQNTPDLTVTAVNLNSATVKDAAGNAANLAGAVKNPSGTLQIDTTAPTVSTISETPSSGSLNAGKLVTYTITMSEAVTLNTTGGSPTLALNDGGTATYVSGSGTNALTFNYTVVAGQNTPDLMVSTFNLNGATVVDGASNGANLSLAGIAQGSPAIDTTAPTVSSVAASGTGITSGSGTIGIGSVVTLTLNLSEAVTVAGGRPTLTLNDGGVATYTGGSGSNALTFSYIVGSSDSTVPALAITQIVSNGATIQDTAGNSANLSGALTSLPNLVVAAPAGGTVIEAFGSTEVVVSGNNYYLLNVSTGTGPILTIQGANAQPTSFSGWSVIGAEQTATGYDVAWKSTSGVYTVWSTDSNGRYLSTLVDSVAGSDATLQALEPTFHQDLNGDGMIGAGTVIEAFGSTEVVVSGNNYYLLNVSTGTGPILTIQGANAQPTSFNGWSVIGAEQTATGYDVAWKSTSGAYTVWSTDSNGRYLSTLVDSVAGSNATLQGLEATFHQDLNGDGVIVLSGSGTIIGANSLTVGSGATVELVGAYSGTVSFAGATGKLVLDQSTKFSGSLGGQLTTTNFIDLRDVTAGAGATVSYTGNNSPGKLSVSDGTNIAKFALSGNYSLGNFIVSSDGNGGTLLVDPPLPADRGSEALASSSDTTSGWLDSIDSKLALWSQLNASAFPSSPFDAGTSGNTGISEIGAVNPAFQVATSAIAQHYQSSLS